MIKFLTVFVIMVVAVLAMGAALYFSRYKKSGRGCCASSEAIYRERQKRFFLLYKK